MKQRRQGFVMGVVTTLMIMSLCVTAFAAAQTINVNGGVKIKLDGKAFTPTDVNGKVVDVFEYNGTTYVPVRAISQAFGKEIAWDGTTRTVIIGSNASSGSYNRQNPAPVGVAQTVTVDHYLYNCTVTIKVNDVLRGDEAWNKVKEKYKYAREASEGKEYIVANISASLDSISEDRSIGFGYNSFKLFSAGNVEYSIIGAPASPDPQFYGDIYQGATLEGYVVYEVDKTDVAPKLSYGNDFDGTGGIWFSLTK